MAQNHKRKEHHTPKSTTNIPARQRVKGNLFWAILFAVFGLLIAFFAAGGNYVYLTIGAVGGAVLGYVVGTKMEEDAAKS
ncbi:MAG: glycine zipper domain-containing protein [Chitinophagaceae bacterium]